MTTLQKEKKESAKVLVFRLTGTIDIEDETDDFDQSILYVQKAGETESEAKKKVAEYFYNKICSPQDTDYFNLCYYAEKDGDLEEVDLEVYDSDDLIEAITIESLDIVKDNIFVKFD